MGRPIPQVGAVEQGYRFKGGDPKSPASWEALQGNDYLKTLAPSDQAMVKMLVEGRMPVPAGFALKSPQIMRYINMAQQYDPTFDAASAPARMATRKDFTSGNSANNIRSLNQALGHLNGMMEAAPQIAGHSGFPLATTINAGINWYEKGAGKPAIVDYNTSRVALSGELASLFKGKGSSSEVEVEKLYNLLSDSNSNEQKNAAAKRLAELMNSRLQELGQQYKQGMGTTAPGLEILNPDASAIYKNLQRFGIDPNAKALPQQPGQNVVGAMGQQPPPQQQPASDPTADLLKKYGL